MGGAESLYAWCPPIDPAQPIPPCPPERAHLVIMAHQQEPRGTQISRMALSRDGTQRRSSPPSRPPNSRRNPIGIGSRCRWRGHTPPWVAATEHCSTVPPSEVAMMCNKNAQRRPSTSARHRTRNSRGVSPLRGREEFGGHRKARMKRWQDPIGGMTCVRSQVACIEALRQSVAVCDGTSSANSICVGPLGVSISSRLESHLRRALARFG